MLEIEAKPFVEAVELVAALLTHSDEHDDQEVGDSHVPKMIKRFEHLQKCCEILNAPLAGKAAFRIARRLKKGDATYGQMREYTKDVRGRLLDELENTKLFVLQRDHAHYYELGPEAFGEDVFNAFSSTGEDLNEATKCLAVGRSTAAVMHMMRVAEIALTSLAKAVGVSQQNDWGSYIREINQELAKKAKSAGKRSADEIFYSEAALGFDHLKRAWRNPTMHIEKTYSPEHADDIFQALGSFMRHLAKKICE